jgi:ribosomal protein L19E
MMIKGNYFKNKKHLEEYVNTPLTPNEEKLWNQKVAQDIMLH